MKKLNAENMIDTFLKHDGELNVFYLFYDIYKLGYIAEMDWEEFCEFSLDYHTKDFCDDKEDDYLFDEYYDDFFLNDTSLDYDMYEAYLDGELIYTGSYEECLYKIGYMTENGWELKVDCSMKKVD